MASAKNLALASIKNLALALTSAKVLALPLMVVVMPIPAPIIRHWRLAAGSQRLAHRETGQEAGIATQLGDRVLVRGLMIGGGHPVLYALRSLERLRDKRQQPSKALRSTMDAGCERHAA